MDSLTYWNYWKYNWGPQTITNQLQTQLNNTENIIKKTVKKKYEQNIRKKNLDEHKHRLWTK